MELPRPEVRELQERAQVAEELTHYHGSLPWGYLGYLYSIVVARITLGDGLHLLH